MSSRRIQWSPRLQPSLLRRLYESDAKGIRDDELCDAVGSYLWSRCETFHFVRRGEVVCPSCGAVFVVVRDGATQCACGWETTYDVYWKSVGDHYAWTGRAVEAFATFYTAYPSVRTYSEKMLLIDQLIHSFHLDERSGPVKSVASKLLEGNKNDVVQFLDRLSARDGAAKDDWRKTMSGTIHRRLLTDPPG